MTMSDPTDRARKLLEAAEHEPPEEGCPDFHCTLCQNATDAMQEMGENSHIYLAAAITLAEALQEEMDIRQGCEDRFSETVREIDGHRATVKALAEWDGLWKEQGNAGTDDTPEA